MVIPWVLASTVGGAVGGLGFVLEFVGPLVLFGGVLGLAQWLVLLRYFDRAGWWVAASFFGWIAGSVAGVFAVAAVSADGRDPAIVFGIVMPWASLGVFQALGLYGLLAVAGRAKLASLWGVVSLSGGVVAGLVAHLGLTALPQAAGAGLIPEGVAGAVAGYGAAGATYGAATGVALGMVVRRSRRGGDHSHPAENRTSRPSAPGGTGARPVWTTTAAGLLALLLLGAGGVLLYQAGTCTQAERAVYSEFAQYGGRRLPPEPNYDLGSCQARYSVDDRPQEVLAYFTDRLRANGWKVEQLLQPPPGAPSGSYTSFVARRGASRYSFIFYPTESYGRVGPGGEVAIDVYED